MPLVFVDVTELLFSILYLTCDTFYNATITTHTHAYCDVMMMVSVAIDEWYAPVIRLETTVKGSQRIGCLTSRSGPVYD